MTMCSSQGPSPCRLGGCPIRRSSDQCLVAAPRCVSPLPTSFIGTQCQGIHRMPSVLLLQIPCLGEYVPLPLVPSSAPVTPPGPLTHEGSRTQYSPSVLPVHHHTTPSTRWGCSGVQHQVSRMDLLTPRPFACLQAKNPGGRKRSTKDSSCRLCSC